MENLPGFSRLPNRQVNCEVSSLTFFALHRNRSAVLHYDPSGNGQAQTRAAFLGRKEGLEYARPRLIIDARSVIANNNPRH